MQLRSLEPLPIDPQLPHIVESLRRHKSLVIAAAPGAGKTTRVPRALYEAGFADRGDILILEPRRLAARLASARVAEELGESVGTTVGYSIRFETVGGPGTRIRFLTEGVLSRRILRDPELEGVSVIILDEFHERHLTTDLAIAFLKRLQDRRPDLRIIVMSATLDADPIASFLQAPVIRGEGSPFPLDIEYEERRDDRPLDEKVAAAVARLSRGGLDGHVLVFLPGSYEIRRAAEALTPAAKQVGFLVLPLHGDLTAAEQLRAVLDSAAHKIILATNVAETSITVPGVAAVIDSGLARMAGHSAWSGLPTITVEKVSRGSAAQRAGRAGRTRRGRVLRLYSRADFDARPEQAVPEIRRADLAETLLLLYGSGIADPSALPWFEAPPAPALTAAGDLLLQLGALERGLRLTETGRRMLRFPVHPRLGRLLVEGDRRGIWKDCCVVAALLSERDIRRDARARLGAAGAARSTHGVGRSDLTELLDLFCEAERHGFETAATERLGLDSSTVAAVERIRRQLRRLGKQAEIPSTGTTREEGAEEALLIAILTAFPDRVAKRRAAGSRELVLAGGGSASLAEASAVHHAELVVAVDAEERRGRRGSAESRGVLVRLASAIEPEWLAGLYPGMLRQSVELEWNERAGRVEEKRRTSFEQVTLEEHSRTAPPCDEASKLLADAVLAGGLRGIPDSDALPAFRARLALLAEHFPEEGVRVQSDEEIQEAVKQLCAGKRSLAELGRSSIVDILGAQLTPKQRSLLLRETPERVDLARRRNVKVHYESGQPPWIESRMQDFFGMSSVPAVCRGKVPLTARLLAPNGRPVQVTRDLAGFWERHYPVVRRELQRRYPKHAWPDPKDVR